MKFRTDVTEGGYKILSIHGPDRMGCYAGVVERAGDIGSINWSPQGKASNHNGGFTDIDLIPITEEPRNVAESNSIAVPGGLYFKDPETEERIAVLEADLAKEEMVRKTHEARLESRINQLYTDCIARINGLRNDYLADKDAVQPARVDDLEERLEKLESRLDKNLPQTLELGQDSVTVSREEWKAMERLYESVNYVYTHGTNYTNGLWGPLLDIRRLRESK